MLLRKLSWLLALLTAFAIQVNAQKNDYNKEWEKVESLEKKGLTKSALEATVNIYKLAAKEKSDGQQIKSCMYQIKYRDMLEEDSRENNIFFLDTLINEAQTPVKNVLLSMQAEMFWAYFQQNRWKFYNRTQLVQENSKDISTWSLEKLHETIGRLYKASILNEKDLQIISLDNLDPIIDKGVNTRHLRPTLFDFLAHRALAYFQNDEVEITRPAYYFTLNDEKAFLPASQFTRTNFYTKDTSSLHYNALLLLQRILKFHLNDKNPDALIDADLIRLEFMYRKSILPNKEKLYEEALKSIEQQYADNPLSTRATYLRAVWHNQQGQKYRPHTDTAYQFEIKLAKNLCETAYAKFPQSEGGIACKNLILQIERPSLNIQTEQVNIPGQPFRNLVTYKNVKTLYVRIIKTNRETIDAIEALDDEKYDPAVVWKAYTDLKPQSSFNIALPDPGDYRQHSTEIKIDELNSGLYIILASINPNFEIKNNLLSKQITQVSNISYISNQRDYYVLNRDNGTPLPNTQVQVWQKKYNYKTRKYEYNKREQYTTDKNGHFTMLSKRANDDRYYLLQLKNDNDELFLQNEEYDYDYDDFDDYGNNDKTKGNITYLFTDRSIYRPGQTVYFKGIVLKKEKNAANSKVLPNYSTTIFLQDANKQKVSLEKVTTNEFGSFHGSIKLPEGLMNGNFTLTDLKNRHSAYFSVEEYKRPKFFVQIPAPKGTYQVNDSIKVTGTAKAYAGNNIDGAKVKYRVVRRIQYPYWLGWWGGLYSYGRESEVEIANGETTTDEKGAFNITFKAIPDETVDKKFQPIFYYDVSADITDINGETRSSYSSIGVAYQMLQLNINLADKMSVDDFKKANIISSTNINGVYEQAKVHVLMQKVQSPTKILRERYWPMPDQFLMNKEEYSKNFPYDIYKDEDKFYTWPLGDKVYDKSDTTSAYKPWSVSGNQWQPGWYKIVATSRDKKGEEVRAEKYIQLTDDKQPTTDNPVLLTVNKFTAEPGEKINYSIKTGFDKVWLIHTVKRMNKSDNILSYPTATNTQSFNNEIAVSEKDRGGINIDYAFVQHNRVYSGSQNFSIPWNNKDLKITFESFRDKLLPGSKEKYTIKVSGNKGDKVAAEMLACMYDASLDQFRYHSWSSLNIWPYLYNSSYWKKAGFSFANSAEFNKTEYPYISSPDKRYDQLIANVWRAHYYAEDRLYDYATGVGIEYKNNAPKKEAVSEVVVTRMGAPGKAPLVRNKEEYEDSPDEVFGQSVGINSTPTNKAGDNQPGPNTIRKNFNETAFFFPDLKTDANGNVSFSFTIPEALTRWKLMTLAHTKDLKSGMAGKTLITQKPLMVQPNAPRFMREGDKMEFSAKVVNLSEKEITGKAQLELLDAATNKPVDGWFKNMFPTQYFTIPAGQSAAVKFPIEIPFNFNSALTYRIVAKTDNASDGEEMALPVLTNRTLVTESLPLNVRSVSKKDFKFEKLLQSGNSQTIKTHALTVEYTSNPAWYAVQSLSYLMEYPYECAEQTFNRFYANILATNIANTIPKIKAVFEKWKTTDTAALLSNLQKNEELKSALLQETPWVLEAKSESQQKKNIALLFDMVRMSNEANKAWNKLKELQSRNGGFVWFKGGPDDRYITQYIISGIGHLRKLNALSAEQYEKIKPVVSMAIAYLDKRIKEDYDYLVRYGADLSKNHLSYTAIQYLYMRSFFSEYNFISNSKVAHDYYLGQAKKYWLDNSRYMQAMVALALHRNNDNATPTAIMKSLKENSIIKEEMGMYWKDYTEGYRYYWYQAPIETQAMMIEAFSDIEKNTATIDDLKTWLLKQKQTQNWESTKATAEACYALLLGGSNWLAEEKEVTITLGDLKISSQSDNAEAGTGYFKQRINGDKVKPEMGNISVAVNSLSSNQPVSSSTSWGAVYWQYFEDLDKITPAETPLKLKKQLFIEKNSDRGPVLQAIGDNAQLKIGDKVKVRIELRVDRDMEYVHMKDMRAACMEPVNVISQYKYQDGLGYYESTKDASTNFFFSYLPKGTYVFEYTLFTTHSGNFSNGITSIQCMYAPEFSSHSEGIRVNVEE